VKTLHISVTNSALNVSAVHGNAQILAQIRRPFFWQGKIETVAA